MPVLPLRDVVVYPHMVIPLFVGREKSIVALDLAMKADKRILLVAQKQADVDDPKGDDLYRVGTVATILQLLKLPTAPSRCWWRASIAPASRSSRKASSSPPK
jgi:ATP-dependent Lon protease